MTLLQKHILKYFYKKHQVRVVCLFHQAFLLTLLINFNILCKFDLMQFINPKNLFKLRVKKRTSISPSLP